MERSASAASLSDLTPTDLASLRLAAQVMSHRALLAGTPGAALYFDSLATAVDGEQAARAQGGGGGGRARGDDTGTTVAPLLLAGSGGDDDRRVIGEYLAVLADNEQLPRSVREVTRALEAELRR